MVTESWKECGIATKFPTYRNSALVTVHSWQQGKRQDDEAEGLWRIHDGIYDFTEFIDKHPGGSFWIRETKGTDITEAFEAHHLTAVPEKMISKYKVRDAAKPRIYTLTLHENGFYKTLKKRVMDKLKTTDKSPKRKSDVSESISYPCSFESLMLDFDLQFIHFGLLLATYLLAIACVKYDSLLVLALAGVALVWTAIVSHNYLHRRDNWQMYTMNLSLMNFCSWRFSHVLSHHIYPNSYQDLELSMYEPLLCWVPNPRIKSKALRYMSWVTEPVAYAISVFLQVGTR